LNKERLAISSSSLSSSWSMHQDCSGQSLLMGGLDPTSSRLINLADSNEMQTSPKYLRHMVLCGVRHIAHIHTIAQVTQNLLNVYMNMNVIKSRVINNSRIFFLYNVADLISEQRNYEFDRNIHTGKLHVGYNR